MEVQTPFLPRFLRRVANPEGGNSLHRNEPQSGGWRPWVVDVALLRRPRSPQAPALRVRAGAPLLFTSLDCPWIPRFQTTIARPRTIISTQPCHVLNLAGTLSAKRCPNDSDLYGERSFSAPFQPGKCLAFWEITPRSLLVHTSLSPRMRLIHSPFTAFRSSSYMLVWRQSAPKNRQKR